MYKLGLIKRVNLILYTIGPTTRHTVYCFKGHNQTYYDDKTRVQTTTSPKIQADNKQ